jgi:hypothetical protein
MARNVMFLAAFQFRLDWFSETRRILGANSVSAMLLRWRQLDVFGYYLATLVLAYVLWRILRPRRPGGGAASSASSPSAPPRRAGC